MTNVRNVFGIFFVLCLFHDCYGKTFYIDYDEDVAGDVYPNPGPKVEESAIIPEGMLVPTSPSLRPYSHNINNNNNNNNEESSAVSGGSWSSGLIIPPPESMTPWGEMMSDNSGARALRLKPKAAAAGFNGRNSFGKRTTGSSSTFVMKVPKQQGQGYYNNLHGHGPSSNEAMMKRQSILYSQCFFNPISCF